VSDRRKRFGLALPLFLVAVLLVGGGGTALWFGRHSSGVRILKAPAFEAIDVAISADGSVVAAIGSEARVVVWEPPSEQAVLDERLDVGAIGSETSPKLALSSDGELLAALVPSSRGSVALVRVSSGSTVARITSSVSGVAFSPDGKELAAAGTGSSCVHFFSVPGLVPIDADRTFSADLTHETVLDGNLTYTPAGDRVAVGCTDGSTAVLDRTTAQPFEFPALGVRGRKPTCVAFGPKGRIFAVGHPGVLLVRLWTMGGPRGEIYMSPQNLGPFVPQRVGFDSDERFLLVESRERARLDPQFGQRGGFDLVESTGPFAAASKVPRVAWIDRAGNVRVGSLEGDAWLECIENEK
jgi:hypothetical protein